ncbi:MAG: ribonuclease III [Flavobacteriales bacterium]
MISFFFKKKTLPLLNKDFIFFLKNKFGVRPINQRLYIEAITHSSYKNIENSQYDNERLEFLGDAFISLAVANYLFKVYPDENEGYLTQLRAKIVSRESLNKIGEDIGLQNFILYQKSSNNYKSLIGNTFEALYGAILIDIGLEKAQKSIEEFILKDQINIDQIILENRDYKSELLMLFQKKRTAIVFKTLKTSHDQQEVKFISEVFSNGKSIGKGIGSSKKAAEQDACRVVLSAT